MLFYFRLYSALLLLFFTVFNSQTSIAQVKAPVFKIKLADAVINVHFVPKHYDMPKKDILEWIRRSAEAVQIYYGQFPLKSTNIYIHGASGRGISGGQAFPGPRPYISLNLGEKTTKQYLKRDWVMVHEMIHLTFPKLDEKHTWLTEGIAVYVESIARLQAGHLTRANAWGSLFKGMPQGLPRYGDKGLDHTPSWGRTYWGGAIFCLVADLEIRKRTKGKMGLQHALRGVLQDGGNFTTYSSIDYALKTGDKATGTSVLMDLYKAWRDKPVDPDLKGIWNRLGVAVRGNRVVFQDKAQLANVRKTIGHRM